MKYGLIVALPLLASITGCVTTPDGSQQLSPVGEAALAASVSIAVRHYIADSPRGAVRAANVRKVVTQVRGFLNEESTLAALRGVVVAEIDKLGLSELDKADAITLLDLIAVALEARLGEQVLKTEGLTHVITYLDLILRSVPD